MNKLYILHKLPTPYNDELFRAFHKAPGIELQVFHLWKGSDRRPWKTELATGYPNYWLQPKLGIDFVALKRAWSDSESLFVIGDWAHSPSIALILARILRRYPVALWVDTPQEHLRRAFWKRVPRKFFLQFILNNVDFVLGSGIPARRELLKLGTPCKKIKDFQFAVSLDQPSKFREDSGFCAKAMNLRNRISQNKDVVVFGMSGQISFQKKAQDIGLKAFADLVEMVDAPIGMVVAGDGPDLDRLKDLAVELNIPERVIFLGWQEPDEVCVFYEAIDVLVHPANFDPFPLVVIEAMSWSRTVIGTVTSGSVEERVVDGVNGFSVNPKDVDGLACAMKKMVDDQVFMDQCKRKAREAAETWPIARLVSIVRKEMGFS